MSSENELKEGNIQQSEENEGSGEIEGYSYCNSHKARCLNDCGGNGQEPETETAEEGVEGYAYCDSHKARCLNDCGGGGKATPFLSDLN